MNKVARTDLFSVPVFTVRATYHEKIKQHLMDLAYPYFKSQGINDKLQNTFTDYGLTPDSAWVNWNFLYSLYLPDVNAVLSEIGVDVKHTKVLLKGWYNFTEHSTAEFVHDHTGGPRTIQFSAVHFVNLDPESQPTVFVNPNTKMIKSTIPTKNLNHLPMCFKTWKVIPDAKEGDIIFFPSWLDHHAPYHDSGKLRLTTALNIMLQVDDMEGD